MNFFKKKKKINPVNPDWKITQKCMDLILECAKSNHPKEFGGLLRVNSENKHVIDELVILPGTVSGDSHAIFRLHMLPIDFTIVGTAHSHPSPSTHPSDADLHLFQKHGRIHIIVAYPYIETSWKAYNYDGDELKITVV